MKHLEPGDRLNLALFGDAYVKKLYAHPETKEIVVAVHCRHGGDIHLSQRYALKRRE